MDNNNHSSETPTGVDEAARRRRSASRQIINLADLPADFSQRQSSSISFNGLSYVIGRLQDAQHRAHAEAGEAIDNDDNDRVEAICANGDRAQIGALFQAAILAGRSPLAQRALKCWASIDSGSHHDDLLHSSALVGDLQLCRELWKIHQLSPNAFDQNGQETPVHYAVKAGQLEVLQFLVEEGGGDINASQNSVDPWTPLMSAVKANQLLAAKWLLDKRALTAPIAFSRTPLHMAAESNNVEAIGLLLSHNAMIDPLRDSRDRETPLHVACSQGFSEAATLLLEKGADPNARNGRGETPLHLACQVLAQPVIQILLEKGAQVEAVDAEERPPLHHLINSSLRGGSRECLQTLASRGANLNQTDKYFNSPVHIAALSDQPTRLEWLIGQGVDLCGRNGAKQTGLQFALKHMPGAALEAVEAQMNRSLQWSSHLDSDPGGDLRLDFSVFLPPLAVHCRHPRSEVEMFSELLRFHRPSTSRLSSWTGGALSESNAVERLLLHPLSQCYLHLKWNQMQKFYVIIVMLTHLIYSLTYSTYGLLVYRVLCPYNATLTYGACQFQEAPKGVVPGKCNPFQG